MKSKTHQTTQSQLKESTTILKELKINVNADDISEALYQLKIGRATQWRYLSGYAKKVPTAIKLIEFYRGRIDDRSKVLSKA
jgi:hypothetical protein